MNPSRIRVGDNDNTDYDNSVDQGTILSRQDLESIGEEEEDIAMDESSEEEDSDSDCISESEEEESEEEEEEEEEEEDDGSLYTLPLNKKKVRR